MEKLKKKALFALEELKKAGADLAQVSVSEGRSEEFTVDAGEFSLIRSAFSASLALKAVKDGKKGGISVNSLEDADIAEAVRDCVAAAENGAPDPAVTISKKEENADFEDGALTCEKEAFLDAVIRFTEDVKLEFPRVMLEQVVAEYSCGKHVLANSNGVMFGERDGSYNVSVMYSAHDGEKTSSFNYFDLTTLDPRADLMGLGMARTMFRRAEAELDAAPFAGKFVGTAVFSPYCLTDVISVIMDNFAGDYALIEGTTPWKNSLGEKVAGEDFSLSVIPNDPRVICGERVTADGYRSRDYAVIEKGVLRSFCLTEYGANRTGLPRAGSTSGCVEVTPGEKTLDEILAGIEKGVLVCRFSGGAPAANGDFSGVAKNSFLIENGRISRPLTETMISGNFADMLLHVEGVSSDALVDGSGVLPYVAFGGVTVSGKSNTETNGEEDE